MCVCVLEVIGVPSMLRLTRKDTVLARVFRTNNMKEVSFRNHVAVAR